MPSPTPITNPSRWTATRPRRNAYLMGAAIAVLVAVPLLIGVGALMWERAGQNSEAPRWITPGVIHASTVDGLSVKAQVALDIADRDARREVEHHMDQINLVLQAAVGSHSKQALAADGGLAALGDDMREKLNDYLGADGAKGVRSVIVADIFYSKP